ncbi:MAG: MlaD family protein [Planctomycetes bacterium]|jgi:paraquat-inducible protein B|nr:MlaD family protein [Planctomycetota bacterium]
MDARPHYFRIGVFVLTATALIVTAVILFGAGLFAQDQLLIESYFAESITGLSEGSPVAFRGVRIGQVERIGFAGSVYPLDQNTPAGAMYASCVRVVSGVLRSKLPEPDSPQVEALLGRMVERGLRVRVSSNLLTQQAFLEVNFLDPNRFPVASVPWQPKHPVIPSAPGEFTTLKDSIDSVLSQLQAIDAKGLASSLEKVFTSLNRAISEADLAGLSKDAGDLLQLGRRKVEALKTDEINAAAQQFLASLNQAVAEANVPELSRQIRAVVDRTDEKIAALDTAQINADLERVLAALDQAVADANVPAVSRQTLTLMAELRTTNKYLQQVLAAPEGVSPPPSVPDSLARLNQVLAHFNALVAAERPSIERVIGDLREITDGLKELIANLEQNPSAILFSKPPKKSEVLK